MAQIQPGEPNGPGMAGEPGTAAGAGERPRRGRKAVRYGVPVAIAGVAAATVGLVPALASGGAPDLPKITAEELVAKLAASDVQQLSGNVKVSTDLGLPELPGMSGGNGEGAEGGSPFGSPHGEGGAEADGSGGEGDGGSAAPQDKLMELASGEHTLRVAADGPDKQRLSIVEDTAEYSLIHNGDEVWGYDSAANSAYHAEVPEGAHKGKGEGKHGEGKHGEGHDKLGKGLQDITPQKAAEQALKAVDDTTSVTVDGTAKVAGRDAYQLVIQPKGAPHSTVDAVRIAVDAENGAPLKFTLMPKGGGKAAIDVGYTKVDFAKPSADTFDFTPPKGTKVTEEKTDGKPGKPGKPGEHGKDSKDGGDGALGRPGAGDFGFGPGTDGKGGGSSPMSGLNVLGEGWDAVAKLDLPAGAAGMQGLGSGEGSEMLDSFTDKVKGEFGTGRVVSTRLVNALMTDDGTVYVGAVSKEGLIKAAEAAAE